MKKGINLKKINNRKFLLIHTETFLEYLKLLPANESGWVAFHIEEYKTTTERNVFAEVIPLRAKEKNVSSLKSNNRCINSLTR